MNKYKEMKDRHQKEVNEFPMFFAFSNKQFDEGMEKLGLKPSDTDKIYTLGGGGYYRRSDAPKLHEMFDRHDKEMKDAMSRSYEFLLDMFNYELANHEYCITYDVTDTLNALGLTIDEIRKNRVMLTALQQACNTQKECE